MLTHHSNCDLLKYALQLTGKSPVHEEEYLIKKKGIRENSRLYLLFQY